MPVHGRRRSRLAPAPALAFAAVGALAAQQSQWTLVAAGNQPPLRSGHRLVFDAARQEVVLFGGFDDTNHLGDTWEWNGLVWSPIAAIGFAAPNQSVWAPATPFGAPRDGFGMTGCVLRHSADILGMPVSPVVGGLEFALPIPSQITLLGQFVRLQAYGYAPGQNLAEIIVSNRLDWRIGDV